MTKTNYVSTPCAYIASIAIFTSSVYFSSEVQANSNTQVDSDIEITLEKIMSDPRWIANSPQQPRWLPNSQHVVFEKNQPQGPLKDTVVLDVTNSSQEQVELAKMHQYDMSDLTYNIDGELAAYIFQGDVFLLDIKQNQLKQLTQTSSQENSPQFLHNGHLAYWLGDNIHAIDLDSNLSYELVSFSMSDQPKPPEGPKDIIAKEQHELIDYVAKKHSDSISRYEHKLALRKQNSAMTAEPIYLGEGQYIVDASLSPKGDKVIVVTAESKPWRGENDLMPNYIGQDGRIQFDKVRRRVSDAEPNQQRFWLVDIAENSLEPLSIKSLPDHDKDVLKEVKIENAKAQGKKYKSVKQQRTINLLVDWTWSQSAIQWHTDGKNVAIMFEAWDNKDRWIATVDLDKALLVNQHQLHDDAWINYTFNQFGWFNESDTLYFLSEQSGYSHIYTKKLSAKRERQITAGNFEVSDVYLTKDDSKFYFRANVEHPGNYQIYSLESDERKEDEPTALTSLKGNNRFHMSPDEQKLLVVHSNLLTPEELYLVDLDNSNVAKRLTHTVTEEFLSMPWTKPEVVQVKSSYADQPIYAKVYYPKGLSKQEKKDAMKRRAVIFNHGAGYLQNSDFGFSGYFREFMFHSMLAQQGYVVMDMDYRASKGYGRDWRTAIYRQMGTPEVQDLRDGVEWLVANANVDRERIGTYGGSYGGFMTFMALFTQPDLFQAGAALRPVSDWAHYNDGYTSNILNRPKDDMLAYRKSSPIYFAEGLEKPLLINAPMIDDNVFFLDVVRLVQRLIELEKEDFETAIYPVEPHGFVQPSSWLDEYRRIYKLFETHL
ncbi:MAG: S9 family peptidase [Gammaproteobacteria bacterium]|nr:S9 family peptidase [Gammaproteobacteria bacterium]